MNHSIRKTLTTVIAAAGLLLPMTADGIAFAEKAVLSHSDYTYTQVEAPVLKPIWSTSVSVETSGVRKVTALAENGKVFLLQPNRKLAALQAATGQKLWEFGSGLAPLFTYSNQIIYGMTTSGSLYAVSESGNKLWTAALSLPEAESLQRIGTDLYVTQKEKLYVVDAATGKLKWKIAEDSNIYTGLTDIAASDGVVIRSYISSGAISTGAIIAYEAQTGRKLWAHSRQSMPLAIQAGLLYSITDTVMLDEDPVNRNVKVSVFNLRTGELKGERFYRWTDNTNTDGVFRSGGAYASAFLDGRDFYVFEGLRLVKYDFWNYSVDGPPVQKWAQSTLDSEYPLNLVLQNRMLYLNNDTGSLSLIKLATGQVLRFSELENPAAQLDVFGSTVYIGQTDGLFHGFDLTTMKPLFTVKTGSRNFRPTLKTGNMLLIQNNGKLLAVKLPASIQ